MSLQAKRVRGTAAAFVPQPEVRKKKSAELPLAPRAPLPKPLWEKITRHAPPAIARRLAALLPLLTKNELEAIETLVRASPATAPILLRAISARLARPPLDLNALSSFAAKLERLEAGERAKLTSVIDRDTSANDNRRDPLRLSSKRGLIYAPNSSDERTNNDGLFQRFTASCGPSVIQMMLAEADPLYAMTLHEAGLFREGTRDRIASFQQELLEAH